MKYLFIFILHVSLTAFGKNNAAPVIAWTGQFLGEGEGAAYLDLKLRKFKKTSRGQSSEVNVVLTLQHSLSNRKYAISQKASISKTPKSYWILPSGSYEMIKITAIDNNGVRRTWAGRKALHVPPLNLTYLGTWTLAPAKKSRLKIKIKNRKPKYKHQFDHQTFIALHDGIKNKVIKELGGKDVQVHQKTIMVRRKKLGPSIHTKFKLVCIIRLIWESIINTQRKSFEPFKARKSIFAIATSNSWKLKIRGERLDSNSNFEKRMVSSVILSISEEA